MSFTNFQKTIALTSGVLVLSVAVALVVIAWTGPSADPPLNNASEPINVSNIAQTKAGDLTVGNLSLDGVGFEGSINNADLIIGANDLRLRADSTEQTKIDLGVGAGEIKFYTGGAERMTVGADGNLYMSGLTDCFLKVDATGKVMCYGGTGVPEIEEEFQGTSAQIFYFKADKFIPTKSDEYVVLDEEAVIKITGKISTDTFYLCSSRFKLFINGVLKKELYMGTANPMSYTEIWYYHLKQNDVIRVEGVITENHPSANPKSEAWLHNLTFLRKDKVIKITSTGDILYCYDPTFSGEMGKAALEYVPAAPSSIAATADGPPIIIFTEL